MMPDQRMVPEIAYLLFPIQPIPAVRAQGSLLWIVRRCFQLQAHRIIGFNAIAVFPLAELRECMIPVSVLPILFPLTFYFFTFYSMMDSADKS